MEKWFVETTLKSIFHGGESGWIVEHCLRVGEISKELAIALALADPIVSWWAGLLHDTGKCWDLRTYLFEGPLSKAQWELVAKHPVLGGKIAWELLRRHLDVDYLDQVLEAILGHHKISSDGMGKPPLNELITLVDYCDACFNPRPYRPNGEVLSMEVVTLELINKGFTPRLVSQVVNRFKAATTRELVCV